MSRISIINRNGPDFLETKKFANIYRGLSSLAQGRGVRSVIDNERFWATALKASDQMIPRSWNCSEINRMTESCALTLTTDVFTWSTLLRYLKKQLVASWDIRFMRRRSQWVTPIVLIEMRKKLGRLPQTAFKAGENRHRSSGSYSPFGGTSLPDIWQLIGWYSWIIIQRKERLYVLPVMEHSCISEFLKALVWVLWLTRSIKKRFYMLGGWKKKNLSSLEKVRVTSH